jgi:Na+/phosphate symporter
MLNIRIACNDVSGQLPVVQKSPIHKHTDLPQTLCSTRVTASLLTCLALWQLEPDSRNPNDITSFLAWSHLIFNVILSIAALPFTHELTAIVSYLIPDKTDPKSLADKSKKDAKNAKNAKPAKR